jgi:hypothetical protein
MYVFVLGISLKKKYPYKIPHIITEYLKVEVTDTSATLIVAMENI